MYLGDYTEDYATLSFKFTTRTTTGAPTTLAGTPVVKVYKANDTGTETATGVTLSVDFDGVTGLNNVLIDLSNGAFFAVAKDYGVIITTGTVGGVSVVGEVVGTFSIENRFAEVDTVKLGGSAIQQASGYIKVSAGTGTGQLSLSSGVIESDMVKIHGTALTETSGQLAGRFINFFDQGSATFSVATALADFKATGFSTHSAVNVWAVATRTLTAFGFSVDLNDDAITAAKFDETTAWPVISADTGATQLARTGADGDTLETLSDQLDGVTTVGAGSNTVTLTIKNQSSVVVEGAAVWVTTDIGGNNVVAGTSYTDTNGQVTFKLDDGTYYSWKQLAPHIFTNPEVFVVAG